MSVNNGDQLMRPSQESFWSPRNYGRTIKRIEDGNKLCNDLALLVKERAEIEKSRANSLKSWSRRWAEALETGPEYGTTASAWKGILTEADRLSDLHRTIGNDLMEDVVTNIQKWQAENYHAILLGLKESKDMEGQFKQASKPWEKLLGKVSNAKQDLRKARQAEQAAVDRERNALNNLDLTVRQVKRSVERTANMRDKVQRAQDKYEDVVGEINKYQPRYVEEMKEVFDKCQNMEKKRLEFFKQTMFSIHKLVNISSKSVNAWLEKVYTDFHRTVEDSRPLEDLYWWSSNFGADMPINAITFTSFLERRDENGAAIADQAGFGHEAPEL